MKKTLDTIFTIVLVVVLVLVGLISVIMIMSAQNDGVAGVFGYSPIVLTDTKSMEPTLTNSDLVIIKDADGVDLEVGDIISFWGFVDGRKSIITHSIAEVSTDDQGNVCYQTQGDNQVTNALRDQDPMNANRQSDIYPEDVIGVYVTHIGGLGAVLAFLKTPLGIMLCLVIPLAALFLWQLIRVIRMAFSLHREAQAEKNAELSEEEKKRVIEEYLKQQQQTGETTATDEAANSATEEAQP